MLLLIFGAGASYDSVPREALPAAPPTEYRPPLANQLLENRHSFGEVLDLFPQCLPLVNPLRRKAQSTGFALEKELEVLLREGEAYAPRKRQFAAFRFYLQQVLCACGDRWGESSHWSTNYLELLSRIDQWRSRKSERVAVVTFNYDTLLERAARDALGYELSSIEAYVASDDWKFFKVHGSVNWGRGAVSSWDGVGDPRDFMIEHIDDVLISGRFFIRQRNSAPVANERLLFPAISVPVTSKTESSFECPADHLRALEELLPHVTKVLIVGWRGMEEHFLELVRRAKSQIHSVFVVSGSEAEARDVAQRFPRPTIAGFGSDGVGFSSFLGRDSVLEGWLG